MTQPTSNELKKEIRNTVSSLKHNDLSVKYNGYSYNVKLKVLVPLSSVSNVANKYRSVSYCEASGEILQGGNTFVSVGYMSWHTGKNETFEVPVPREAIDQVEKVLERFENSYWEQNGYDGKFYHLSNAVNADCEFFSESEWNHKDVVAALREVANHSPRLYNWLYGTK